MECYIVWKHGDACSQTFYPNYCGLRAENICTWNVVIDSLLHIHHATKMTKAVIQYKKLCGQNFLSKFNSSISPPKQQLNNIRLKYSSVAYFRSLCWLTF